MATLSVVGRPIRPWPTSLGYTRNSGDGKRIHSTSLHLPLTRRTVHCPHVRDRPPASLVLLDEVWTRYNQCSAEILG